MIDDLSLLPTSPHVTVRAFLGEEEQQGATFSFFCVEYVHGWLEFVDDVAMAAVRPLSGEGVLLPAVCSWEDDEDEEGGEGAGGDPFSGIEHDEMDLSSLRHLPHAPAAAPAAASSSVAAPAAPVLNRLVPDGTITLEACLQLYTAEEVLDEANSWYCSRCGTHRQAFKTLQFYQLPPVLIFGLKRFETRAGGSVYGSGGGKSE